MIEIADGGLVLSPYRFIWFVSVLPFNFQFFIMPLLKKLASRLVASLTSVLVHSTYFILFFTI